MNRMQLGATICPFRWPVNRRCERERGIGDLMKKKGSVSGISMLLFLCSPVSAHHGNSAYDETARVPIKGVITEFVWTNPHSQIYMDVKDKDGNVAHWAIETNSPGILTRAGWTRR